MDFFHQLIAGMTVLAILSAIFNVSSNIPYVYEVMTNPDTRPSFTTWFIWGSLDVVRAILQYSSGEMPYQMIGSSIGIGFILLAGAWMRSFVRLTIWDAITVLGVAGAMYLAFAFSEVVGAYVGLSGLNVALTASIVAVALGALPMYIKTIKSPYSEPAFPWVLVWLACASSLANILNPRLVSGTLVLSWEKATYAGMSVPTAFMTLTSILLATIWVRRIAVGPKPKGLKVSYSGH